MTTAAVVMIMLWTGSTQAVLASDERMRLRASPETVVLEAPESSDRLLIFASADSAGAAALETDVTRRVTWQPADSTIVSVSSEGRVIPLRDGLTTIGVTLGDATLEIPVRVTGLRDPRPVSFSDQVIPILSKAGCNAGGCHGKAEGQNGFRLSVFGYDADHDYDALVREGRGRRVFPASPAASLLLTKATARVPHGGGRRIEPESRWHRLLQRWISEGMPQDQSAGEPIVQIRVTPAEVTLAEMGEQQLRVEAVDAVGRVRPVTAEAEFQSNNDVIAGADAEGLIRASSVPGECAILVRYLGHVAVSRVIRPGRSTDFRRPPEQNFVDRLVWDKLERLRVNPAELADDSVFLRRVCLDTIGTLPTSEESRQFLADRRPDKRQRLIGDLLQRPEYSDYQAQRWSDLLRVDRDILTSSGAVAMTRWIRRQIQANVPYDEFVRQILTVRGSTLRETPAGFFQVHEDPEKTAAAVSQLFLGVRIECAQCHHHPFERWEQRDYFAWAGLFTGIHRVAGPAGSLRIGDQEGQDLTHPRTGLTVKAAGLGSEAEQWPAEGDRRQLMAEWLTSRSNPWFTRVIVNRLVAQYFGRGLVEPIDDLRDTNPAANEPLFQALCLHLQELNYDLRAFTKTLLESRVYQLSTQPVDQAHADDQNYSHALWRTIPAEVLLDAVSHVTGVPEEFNGWPTGYRAIQVWDHKLPSHFLEIFGRPARQSVCSCERGAEPSLAQALHLMNADSVTRRLQAARGRAARLAESEMTSDQMIEELYLTVYARYPFPEEQELMRTVFAEVPDRRTAIEDIIWTLMNTREFVLNH